ncbi:MAG: hypothetical protein E7438_06195 [Ruminococcaceae bacterium]|nr:hypothetical protein [Oscillospiraceae bacterium]
MEKFNRFVTKYVRILYFASCAVMIALGTVLTNQNVGLGLIVMYGGILLCSWFLRGRMNALIKEPLRMYLEECDPEPYREEMQKQKGYGGFKAMEINRQLGETTAMIDLGQYQQAYMLLLPMEQAIMARRDRGTQMAYCGQMGIACRKLGMDREAEDWIRKSKEVFGKIKNRKIKQQFADILRAQDAWIFCRQGQYDPARQLLDQSVPQNMRNRVRLAMNYAGLYLSQGENDLAKQALRFVAEHGNKLYIATQARQMLAEMAAKEEM